MRKTARNIRNVNDARKIAKRRLPPALFDYVDGAAEDERTLKDNLDAFAEVRLLTRAAAYYPDPKLSRTIFGRELSIPLILSPCGGVRLLRGDGDRAVARAAGNAGIGFAMSTGTRTAPEDMMAAATGPLWFQLYMRKTREASVELIDRVQDLGYGALFVTVDGAGQGNIERIFAHKAAFPMRKSLGHGIHYAPQMVRRPLWTKGFILDGMPTNFEEFQKARTTGSDARRAAAAPKYTIGTETVSSCPTWEDIVWIREQWKGHLVIKGLLTPDDALRARDHGADGIVVSNHGGRQLDTAPATLRVLPGIRAAIGDDLQILIDGGIRRGADIIKVLALGADAAMAGRPYLFGLAAAGQPGVERILELFRTELKRALAQMGLPSIDAIDASCIDTSRFTPVDVKPLP